MNKQNCIKNMYMKAHMDIATILLSMILTLRFSDGSNDLYFNLKYNTKEAEIPGCPKGCSSCSVYNGCVTCRPEFYLYLTWRGVRQMGVCVRECPAGYYSSEKHDFKKCNRCSIQHCANCQNSTVCLSCSPPGFLKEGKCVEECPPVNLASSQGGMAPRENHSNRKTEPKTHNNQSCHNRDHVDCSVGQWEPWTLCKRRDAICGYKRGKQTRTRAVLDFPSGSGRACPALHEKRKCKMKYRFCEDLLLNTNYDFSRMVIRFSPAQWRRHIKNSNSSKLEKLANKNKSEEKKKKNNKTDKNRNLSKKLSKKEKLALDTGDKALDRISKRRQENRLRKNQSKKDFKSFNPKI